MSVEDFFSDPLWLAAGIFVAGGIGAVLRYLLQTARPYGLIVVNIIGTVLLGVMAGWGGSSAHPALLLIIGTGLTGGLTTFSAVALEWAQHVEARAWSRLGWALRRHLFGSVVGAAAGLVIGAQIPY